MLTINENCMHKSHTLTQNMFVLLDDWALVGALVTQ